jgi:F-type H+-transporting ATPase subunit delta
MNENSVKNCAKVLLSLNVPQGDTDDVKELWESSEELRTALSCPAVGRDEKYRVIDRAFPESMRSFLKVMEKYGHIGLLSDILDVYEKLRLEQRETLGCTLYCAAEPDKETVKRFEQTVCKKYGAAKADLEIVIDESLIGGYVLKVGDTVYDRSVKAAVRALQSELTRG